MGLCVPKDLDKRAIQNFREYLRIPSVHPNVNYTDCLEFLKKQAKILKLPVKVYYIVPKKPIVVLTWMGTEPTLPSILLNSHMDVVPVFESQWMHNPFSADIDIHNNIYARGSQDTKSIGIQYLEAIGRLKRQKVTLKRTVHVSFVPDEEIGGIDGMKQFVHTKAFQELNVGVALDEGTPNPTEEFRVFYGERSAWHFHIHCPGDAGHEFSFLKNTAEDEVTHILNQVSEFRKQQVKLLEKNPTWSIGDVISINLTQISGGVQTNTPSEFVLSFDGRIPPKHFDYNECQKTIQQLCIKAGPGVWLEFDHKDYPVTPTKLDNSNLYWVAFKEATDKLGLKLQLQISPTRTDASYVRSVGIPTIGFSPMNNTPVLVHGDDEYLGVSTFLKGIEIYCEILISIGNKTEQ